MKLGVSNRFFYYSGTGNGTFDQRYAIYLKDSLDFDAMNKAIEKTLYYYPEYKQRIVIKNNRFDAIENDKCPIIFRGVSNHKYMSDEVNNFAYFFTYDNDTKELMLNACHGVSDGLSIIKFYTSLLYQYASILGDSFTDDELLEIKKRIRTSKDDLIGIDEEIMYDPYFKFHDENAKPEFKYICDDAFYFNHKQYDEDASYIHLYELSLSTSDFIKRTKEIGTTFAPLLIYAISKGISESYAMDGRPVVAMLPLDCRRIFNIDTMVNFADGIFLPFENSDLKKDILDVCDKLKDYMIKQQTKENMSEIMASKVKKLELYENGDKSIYDIVKENQKMLPVSAKRPSTYAMSYSGKVDFTNALNKYVTNFKIFTYVRAYYAVTCTYADNLNIMIGLRSDDRKYPESIKSGFENLGFNASLIDKGKLYANIIDVNEIKVI